MRQSEGNNFFLIHFRLKRMLPNPIRLLKDLPESQKGEAIKILDHVQKNSGVPFPKGFDRQVIDLLINLGIIDYSKITTASKVNDISQLLQILGERFMIWQEYRLVRT